MILWPRRVLVWTLLRADTSVRQALVFGRLAYLRVGSRGAVASYLGSAQLFDLLRRLQLSVFDHIYGFCSGALARDWTVQSIPSEVLGELLLDMTFSLFGRVDMQLPFLLVIAATDASTEFGHGGVVAQANIDVVRKIARMACKSGGHVRVW